MRTKTLVNGITEINPATEGNLFAIPVAEKMIIKLSAALIRICTVLPLTVNDL
jgi:hypothetical protein